MESDVRYHILYWEAGAAGVFFIIFGKVSSEEVFECLVYLGLLVQK